MKETKEIKKILKMRLARVFLSRQNSNFWHFLSNPPSKLEWLYFKLTILYNKGQELFV